MLINPEPQRPEPDTARPFTGHHLVASVVGVALGTAVAWGWYSWSAPAPTPLLPPTASAPAQPGGAYLIVDKPTATVSVYSDTGVLVATSPVLLGAAFGDTSAPGIGTRALNEVREHEKITPAGRFIGRLGTNLEHESVVWLDYDAGVSMHRVRLTNAADKRLERLRTPGIEDNRISFGCINLPADFYEQHVEPIFLRGPAVIQVTPDLPAVARNSAAAH